MKSLLLYGTILLALVLVLWLIIPCHKITISPVMGQSDEYAEQLRYHLAGMIRNMETKEFIQNKNIPELNVTIYNFSTNMRIEVRVNNDPFPATTYWLNKKLPAHIAAAMVIVTVIDPIIRTANARQPRKVARVFC